MGVANKGTATCRHCGACLSLVTIFNRDMQGFAKVWKRRHERRCGARTPAERRAWAKPYAGKDVIDSALTVDLEHPGFRVAETSLDTATEGR